MRKPFVLLSVLLVVAALITSCGPAVQPVASTNDGGEVFNVSFPQIVIDLDRQGVPSIEGVAVKDVAAMVGYDMSAMRVDPAYVNWMMNANVQHIETRQAGNGLLLLVNGQLMPFLGWSDASLQRASMSAAVLTELFSQTTAAQSVAFTPSTAQSYSSSISLVGKLLPIVRRLGLDVVVRFPTRDGVQKIALADSTKIADPKPVASGKPASYVLQFEMKYDKSGMPAVLGITPLELKQSGIDLGATNLGSQAIKTLQARNIQTVELRGKEDGLFVFVNGEPLPSIAWDDTMIQNASQVYGQMNDQNNTVVRAITQLLPMVNRADIGVLIHLPVADGVAAIPAKMHD